MGVFPYVPVENETSHSSQKDENTRKFSATKPIYNKRLDFSSEILLPDRAQHDEKIVEAILNARSRGLSVIILFRTIAQCQRFSTILDNNRIQQVQIFDDGGDHNNVKRFAFSMILEQSGLPGWVTLTTAIGGRAVDFSNINIGNYPGS